MSNKIAIYNKILEHIGAFGSFQQRTYIVLNLLTIAQCCHVFVTAFLVDKPQWSCLEPQDTSLLDPNTLQEGYPCFKNGSICKNMSFRSDHPSITTQFGLVCNQEYLVNFGQSVILAGGLVGAMVFGRVSDNYGRRVTIITMQSLAALFTFCSAFTQSYNQFVLCMFMSQAFLAASGMTIFVLLSEILGPSSRDFLLSLHQAFYSLGFVVLAVLAYFIRDWRVLTLVLSLPLVLGTISFLYGTVCESPQWLLEKGRLDESKQLLKEMAKKNGTEIPEKYLEELFNRVDKEENLGKSQNTKSSTGFNMQEILKLIILSCMWLMFGMLYNGLSYSSESTSNNKYISFGLSGVVELPSLLVSILVTNVAQKRLMAYLVMFAAFSCFLCTPLLGGEWLEYGVYVTLLVMVGKFGITAAFNTLYIFSAGLFSATVRNTSLSICSLASHGGGSLAPLVVYLESYDKRLPMLVYGLACFSLGVLILMCPDASDRDEMPLKKVE